MCGLMVADCRFTFSFSDLFRPTKKKRAARMAITATAPTTMPAMAPPERLLESLLPAVAAAVAVFVEVAVAWAAPDKTDEEAASSGKFSPGLSAKELCPAFSFCT